MYGIETIRKLNERTTAAAANVGTAIQRHSGDSARLVAFQAEAPQVTEVTSKFWKSEVLDSPVPVVVDFYADSCGPCLFLAPIVDQLAREFNGIIKFARVDVDKNETITGKYDIQSIPTVVIFRSDKALASTVGAKPKKELLEFITRQQQQRQEPKQWLPASNSSLALREEVVS
jgi:thioredoxin 1